MSAAQEAAHVSCHRYPCMVVTDNQQATAAAVEDLSEPTRVSHQAAHLLS